MENFKHTVEKRIISPSFVSKTKEIMRNASFYIKGGAVLVLFSLGKYEVANAQNQDLEVFQKNSLEWFDGKISADSIIKNIYQEKDDSYLKLDIKEKNKSVEKETSGNQSLLENIKIGNDTNNLGNIDIETFGFTSTSEVSEDNKSNMEETSQFSYAIRQSDTVEKTNEIVETKTFSTISYGDDPKEIIIGALSELSESTKCNVMYNNQEHKIEEKNSSTTNFKSDFKSITTINSKNTFYLVKAVAKETSPGQYSISITYSR